MDILAFTLAEPPVAIAWGISESELSTLMGPLLRRVTHGYYAATCTSLPGLTHELGFHVEPRLNGRLKELEFFRRAYPDQMASYQEFQGAFEREFGSPYRSSPGDEGFPAHEWIIGSVVIRHFVLARFGPEEHMRVRHIAV